MRRAYKHVLKSPRLHSAIPLSPRVAFRNTKTIRDKLLSSKLKEFVCKDAGTNKFIRTVIYVKYLKVEISLKVRLPRKNTALILHLIVTVVS